MIVASRNKSPDWTPKQLMKVLQSLKTSKSPDHFGMIYELFKPEIIGTDLFKSLLLLCNAMKRQQEIPKFLKYMDITSFYKNKGDRKSLENKRGVLGVVKVNSG